MPTWARRVTQQEIRRLYETDARGIYDEDLINEVGYGLLARCQSFVVVNRIEARQRGVVDWTGAQKALQG